MGYHDAEATLRAVRVAFEIVGVVLARVAGEMPRSEHVRSLIEQTRIVMSVRQPDYITRSLLRVARQRGIPVQPAAPGSRVWLYGQGSSAFHCWEAASHGDSMTGARLAQDKFLSNQLVKRLGLPGVTHSIAQNLAAGRAIARQFGFPLVVKPIDRGRGRGVTAHITDDDEFAAAFAKAIEFSPRGVIVERHVYGDDHRLAVFGGKFKWAVRRSPPRIVGDAKHTVAELIEAESASRSEADVRKKYVARLVIDEDMRRVLAKQNLALTDRPAAGREIHLRTIANTATGGLVTDCSFTIHPDNRALAETIARGFHMDALGIDFMTRDITRSWRESGCAVLEVNRTPGFSSDGRAELILAERFPDGADGRIPSVVIVGGSETLVARVVRLFTDAGLRVGETDDAATRLAGIERCARRETLSERVTALLLDPACDALIINAAATEIERAGLPLDRCDVAVVLGADTLATAVASVIADAATTVLSELSRVDETLTRLIAQRRGPR
ncbi:MAG: hypothetical protein HC809_13035 [Gammaproteobacteria bacterium]|nr:hypothetical protein [Gammaproteobacteria bacterium]